MCAVAPKGMLLLVMSLLSPEALGQKDSVQRDYYTGWARWTWRIAPDQRIWLWGLGACVRWGSGPGLRHLGSAVKCEGITCDALAQLIPGPRVSSSLISVYHVSCLQHRPYCGNYLVTTFRNKSSRGKSECKLRSLIPKIIEPSESSRGHAICSLKELHSSENHQSSGLGVWD